jgi:hypothetical protein
VQVTSATWWATIRIVAGVGDLVQRTRDGCIGLVLGGWAIERSSDVVSDLYCAQGDEEHRVSC